MIRIALPPEIESRLKGEALRQGVSETEYVSKIVLDHLPPTADARSLSALLAQWDAEDATDDPVELARRREENEEFQRQMNLNRLEMEGPGSRRLFP
jgi:hypothetical protein